MANADTPMPFGKHKGTTIGDLPSDYLKWMAENMSDEPLCEAADEEYSRRSDDGEHWYNEGN